MKRAMQRSQIQFSDEQLTIIRQAAAAEGISIAEVVRRAVERFTAQDPHQRERTALRARAAAVAGRYTSGMHTVAADHDDHLAQVFHS